MVKRKEREPPSMTSAVRSASRWMWASAALDAIPILGMALAMAAASGEVFNPGVYPLILLGVVVVSVFSGTCAWWKVRAGRLLRDAAGGRGDALASAFVLLRRYFAAMLISSVFLIVVIGVVGSAVGQ